MVFYLLLDSKPNILGRLFGNISKAFQGDLVSEEIKDLAGSY
jgi:hypothetical protein